MTGLIFFSKCFIAGAQPDTFIIMMLYRNWTRGKLVIVVLLIWCRLIGQNIIGVNCNFNHIHNILMRNTIPCAINSLCMCTNAGNGTHSYKISCHDVWFYKFTGKFKAGCKPYTVRS